MKKTILALAAIATMVACSKDEIVNEAPKVPIAFNNAFVENTTRAIDGTYNNSNKPSNFLVYGYTQGDETGAQPVTIFDAVNVEYKDNTKTYEYDTKYTQYWIDGNKYGFAALVNADKEKVEKNNVNGLPSKVTFTSDSETDLLYATSNVDNVTPDYDTPVAFTFDHLLSKVHITFKNTITTNSDVNKYTYKVTNIFIDNAISVADCDLETKKWSNHQDSNPLVVEFGNITDDDNDSSDAIEVGAVGTEASATSHYARLLIPGNYNAEGNNPQKMTLIFTVETLINHQSVDKRDYKLVVDEELEAGHAYNFIISKGAPGKQIKFTVEKVNEWDTDHDDNDVMPDNTPLS